MTDNTLPVRLITDTLYYISDGNKETTMNLLAKKLKLDIYNVRSLIFFIGWNFYNELYLAFDGVDSAEVIGFEFDGTGDFAEGKYDNAVITLNNNLLVLKKSDYKRIESSSKEDYSSHIIFKEGYDSKLRSSTINVSLLSTISKLLKNNKTAVIEANGKKYYPIGINFNTTSRTYHFYTVTEDETLTFIPCSEAKFIREANYPRYLTKSLRDSAHDIQKHIWKQEEIPLDSLVETVIFRVEDTPVLKKILYELSNHDYQINNSDAASTEISLQIIVTPSFIGWLQSYGSSVVVLNNQTIIDEIINTYKEVYLKNK